MNSTSNSAEDSTPHQMGPKSRDATLQYQRSQLHKLLDFVWNRSVFYREFYEGHGIRLKDLADLSITDLPLLSKKTLIDNFDLAVTDPRVRKKELEEWFGSHRDPGEHFCKDLVTLHSSGTSGNISISAYDRKAWAVADATMAGRLPLPENFPAGLTKVAFYIVPDGHFATVSMAKTMPENIYDILLLSLLTPTEETVRKLNAFQPHRLTGYSSGVAQMAELALEGRLQIHPQRIIVYGDRLTESMEKKIQAAWNVPVYMIYAALESKFIAIRTPEHDQLIVMDDLNIVEVLDDRDLAVAIHQEGRVLLTNLYNYTLPILRYELGDYVVRGHDIPGVPFTTIRDIRGRVNDALPVVLSDGRHDSIHPMVLTTFIVPTIEKIQFVSASPTHIRIDYIARQNMDAEVRREFDRMLIAKGPVRTVVDVRRVPAIENDPKTGKLRLVKFEDPAAAQSYSVAVFEAPNDPEVSIPARPQSRMEHFAEAEIEQSISSRFEQQVEMYADRLAIRSRTQSLSYRELNRAANRIAHAIVARLGTEPGTVALLLQHGIPAVIAILGILKAGKTYLPLDPGYPATRLAGILEEAQSPLLITDTNDMSLAMVLAKDAGAILNLDTLDSTSPQDNLQLVIAPDALAYLFFTSGSTGRPKGVAHSHRSALHQIMTYSNALRLTAEDRIIQLHSHAFSASRLDIFGALLNGSALFPFSLTVEGMGSLTRWLIDQDMTVLHWIPTAFRLFAETLDKKILFSALRCIVLGSETVTARDFELYKRHFADGSIFVNRFGSTETGNIRMHFLDKQNGPDTDPIPVGYPIADTEVLLLDETGASIPGNQVGEIAVKSSYLPEGYWRRPDLSRDVFYPAPGEPGKTIYRTGDLGQLRADGCLIHLGRKDLQVKIRGYRVEAGEVERALVDHSDVAAASVAVRPDAKGDKCLVAYYVSRNSSLLDANTLRHFLERRLPGYMIPQAFVRLETLPLTPTGKIDREALPDPGLTRQNAGTPIAEARSSVEETLAGIWSGVLGIQAIHIDDNFFDLGGHSLHAMMIVSRVAGAFHFEASVRDFFEMPTIAHMAEMIERASRNSADDPELSAMLAEIEALSEDEARRLLEKEDEE